MKNELINEAEAPINTCQRHARTELYTESEWDGTLAMLYLAQGCIQNTTDACLISTEE